MEDLSLYEIWQIVNTRNIQEGAGEFFSPEYAREYYDVDFTKLRFKKHYDVSFSCIINHEGAKPSLSIQFTDKGIKKLLKTNQKMIEDLKKGYVAILKYDRDYPKSEEPRKAITKHIVKGGTR